MLQQGTHLQCVLAVRPWRGAAEVFALPRGRTHQPVGRHALGQPGRQTVQPDLQRPECWSAAGVLEPEMHSTMRSRKRMESESEREAETGTGKEKWTGKETGEGKGEGEGEG